MMKKLGLLLFSMIAIISGPNAQVFSPSINKTAGSANKLISLLFEFEKKGVKELGMPALNNTCDWLMANYQNMGYQPVEDSFLYNGLWLRNVITEKKGTSDKYIIVCGHYDTRTGPGANDNGSGVCTIMEMARLMQPLKTIYTIRFIHFSAEEVGLIGSRHYSQNITGANDTNLLFVFNLDQLGGTRGADNSRIKCERDENNIPATNNAASALLTDSLGRLMSLYSNLVPVISHAYASDYMPFENLGYVITGLYQHSNDPANHSELDLVQNMDTNALKEVAKGAIASLLYFSRAEITDGVPENKLLRCRSIYPNPTNGQRNVYIDCDNVAAEPNLVQVCDPNGRIVSSEGIDNGFLKLPSDLRPGLYFVRINRGNLVSVQKLIVSP